MPAFLFDHPSAVRRAPEVTRGRGIPEKLFPIVDMSVSFLEDVVSADGNEKTETLGLMEILERAERDEVSAGDANGLPVAGGCNASDNRGER